MKTLLVTTSFPPVHGGIETYLHALANSLDGHEVIIGAPLTQGSDAFDGAAPFKIVRFNREFEDPGYWEAVRVIRKNLFDIRNVRTTLRMGCAF